jgi:hypothetical protein
MGKEERIFLYWTLGIITVAVLVMLWECMR